VSVEITALTRFDGVSGSAVTGIRLIPAAAAAAAVDSDSFAASVVVVGYDQRLTIWRLSSPNRACEPMHSKSFGFPLAEEGHAQPISPRREVINMNQLRFSKRGLDGDRGDPSTAVHSVHRAEEDKEIEVEPRQEDQKAAEIEGSDIALRWVSGCVVNIGDVQMLQIMQNENREEVSALIVGEGFQMISLNV
jgi:hypothetical protein